VASVPLFPDEDDPMRVCAMPGFLALIFSTSFSFAADKTPPLAPDVPKKSTVPTQGFDYERREVMIPMRDGIKPHAVIMIPKGTAHAPIILTRTPYNASKRAERGVSPVLLSSLPQGDEQFSSDGYIRVFQDIRGKYGSEGDYVMTRPLRGPLNDSKVDHSTDVWDTIDWLVKNVHESNGRVGMIGSSYEGFTVLMALVHPHPALKAAVPMSPMVDGWKGDDWFHNGAFRQTNLEYIYGQTTAHGEGKHVERQGYDDYENFLRLGSPATTRVPMASTNSASEKSSPSIRLTMPIVRATRWTRLWRTRRWKFRPWSWPACGTRRTCTGRSMRTR
jgi:uncharacterized protein